MAQNNNEDSTILILIVATIGAVILTVGIFIGMAIICLFPLVTCFFANRVRGFHTLIAMAIFAVIFLTKAWEFIGIDSGALDDGNGGLWPLVRIMYPITLGLIVPTAYMAVVEFLRHQPRAVSQQGGNKPVSPAPSGDPFEDGPDMGSGEFGYDPEAFKDGR